MAPPSGLSGMWRSSARPSARRVAGMPKARSSSGTGGASASTTLSPEAITTKRSAAAATIFSRVWAPPPPLTSQPPGSTWSAPSIAMSSRSRRSNGSTSSPSARAAVSVATEVATQRRRSSRRASAGSRCATVLPVPSPTVLPSSTSAAAASAAARFSASRSAIDGDAERRRERLTGRHEPQPVVGDERIGGCGHRLEADQVLAGRGEHLGVRVALEELDPERAAAARDRERARALWHHVGVVERAVFERAAAEVRRRVLARGDHVLVEHERSVHGQLDLPVRPRRARDDEVGVVAEGDGHRHRGGRCERRPDGERVVRERDLELEAVGVGEALEALAVELRLGAERVAAILGLPAQRIRGEPVDRQAVLLDLQQGRVAVELDLLAADAVGEAGEPVGPRGQEGDAEGRAGAGVLVEALALREQLLAAVGQRAAHHPGLWYERGLELARGRAEAHDVHDGVVGTSSRSETASTISTSSSSERPPPSPSASQVTRIIPVATVSSPTTTSPQITSPGSQPIRSMSNHAMCTSVPVPPHGHVLSWISLALQTASMFLALALLIAGRRVPLGSGPRAGRARPWRPAARARTDRGAGGRSRDGGHGRPRGDG